ncbi:ABC transporter substrate-binding protein [Poseidonocella sp. HB161398]|uniref:ABC transporter substrate-binding protein n=1 Tax=Poseidonocella sp. HB161398 TaxID=2320855 RepID=UPI0011089541|nr:ABC transporter substrate-binding protein [Poseidonocella sp. HB161398]
MLKLATAASTLALLAGAAAAKDTISFAFTDDDPAYIERMGELVDEFEAANPDIEVEFITAGYSQLVEQLPLQLAVGEGPDLAKIADHGLMRYTLDLRPYMADPDGFAALHGSTLNLLKTADAPADKIGGFMLSQTLNLPFVNKTLWEQAGEPLPEPGATLDEIVEASQRVADATGIDIPFTMDRSGHRFTGPAFSYGAHYEVDGHLAFPDDAAKAYIADMYRWTQEGAFPKEMWGAAGGSRYKNMGDEFVDANVATYFAGNWMVNPFRAKIGQDFEWTVLDAPCGPGGCVPMPGGTFLAAFNTTDHPEAVAKLVEFLGSEKVVRELAERFIIIPGANIQDLEYQLDDPSAAEAMKVFARNAPNVTDEIREWSAFPGIQAVQSSIVQRMTQLIVGEMSLEDTYARLESDIASIDAELSN